VRKVDPLAAQRENHGAKTKALEASSTQRIGDVADYWEQSRMLRLAGLGFSDQENYALSLSIRKLAASRADCKSARFWGKILGTEQDYYVVELSLEGQDQHNRAKGDDKIFDEIEDSYVEPRGTGANQFVYMVCNDLTEQWVQLPSAVPTKIVRSRQINRLLTGRLDAPVWSHPAFPWPEVDLLRSMIARITHSTMLSPEGFFAPGPEGQENELLENKEFAMPEDPAAPEAWVHCRPYLGLNGRISYPDTGNEKLADDKYEALRAALDKAKEKDFFPEAPILGGIAAEEQTLTDMNEARGLPEQTPAPNKQWFIRKTGDLGQYDLGEKGVKSYAVTVVSSERYPGAFVVSQGSKFCNVYIGNMVKKQRAFLPQGVSDRSDIAPADATRFNRSKGCNFELAPGVIQDEPDETKELITQEDQEGEDQLGAEGEDGEEDEEPGPGD
jgi:radial spoke head protein 4A